MIDPARLKGLLAAAACVALALGGFSLAARATLGGRPGWLAGGDSTIEAGQEAIVGGRIAGASARFRRGERPDDLGVILGSSAVSMAVDPAMLGAEAGPGLPSRWLSLYANGANLDDIHGLAELLFGSELHPKFLVLGIHPGLLARSDHYLSDRTRLDAAPFRERLAARQLLAAKDELADLSVVPLNRLFPNRTRVSNRVRGLAAGSKRRMFAALGLGAEAMYRADPDPWSVRLLIDEPTEPIASAEGRKATVRDQAVGPMREGLAGPVKDKGWSDPGAYSADSVNAHSLVATIREARARGIEVALLLLPERSNVRGTIPPEADRALREALRLGFGDAAPPVIDLRATVPDDEFHDSIHPARASRPGTTRRLIEALRAGGRR